MSDPGAGWTMPTRLTAVLVLVVALAVGGLIGVAVDRRVLLPHGAHGKAGRLHGPGRGDPFLRETDPARDEALRRHIADDLSRQLSLTTPQRAQVDSLTRKQMVRFQSLRAEIRPRIRATLDSFRTEIESVLTPEQREKFRTMRRGPPHRED